MSGALIYVAMLAGVFALAMILTFGLRAVKLI
jgi:hypothetical protein